MSTRAPLLIKLANLLEEAVDLDKVKAVSLSVDKRITFTHNENEFGMEIQPIETVHAPMFPSFFKIDKVDLEGYFNFGFDFKGTTSRVEKATYRELGVPLAIIAKSMMEWVKLEKPKFIVIFVDSSDEKENTTKINLYSGLLNREKSTLDRLGYTWDYFNSPFFGKSIYVNKIKR